MGHTITGKSYKVSYKSKKTKKNPEEKQYFFPNTHEPLIDEETFDLAQKRIATKHRPTKVNEIDIFSGLLFCGDCGYKMYLQQGAGTLERKHAYEDVLRRELDGLDDDFATLKLLSQELSFRAQTIRAKKAA